MLHPFQAYVPCHSEHSEEPHSPDCHSEHGQESHSPDCHSEGAKRPKNLGGEEFIKLTLIVGLGNPGRNYTHNRHNIGFRCINYLAKQHAIPVKKHQCHSQLGMGKIASVEVLLAKPKTYVNESGKSVSQLVRKYKIPPEDLLVIYDDLDLPLGKIRIRQGGSAGGHKGIKSIISSLGSQDFCRIKIGIGRPTNEDGTPLSDEDAIVGYVLSDFTPDEDKLIKPAIATVAEAVQCFLTDGIIAAMNKFN